jgi:hypothetical protein
MRDNKHEKTKDKIIREKGWFVPSLHKKYLNQYKKDKK